MGQNVSPNESDKSPLFSTVNLLDKKYNLALQDDIFLTDPELNLTEPTFR